MADLNLRGIDPALKAKLKSMSASHRMTLTEYCFLALRAVVYGAAWKPQDRGVGVAATPLGSKPKSAGSSPAAPAKITVHKPEEWRINAKAKSLSEATRVLSVIEEVDPAELAKRFPRAAHDPKTCRIYRCGMCASKGGKA